jgi:hypothetical protein
MGRQGGTKPTGRGLKRNDSQPSSDDKTAHLR